MRLWIHSNQSGWLYVDTELRRSLGRYISTVAGDHIGWLENPSRTEFETRDQNEIREWVENSSDGIARQIVELKSPAPQAPCETHDDEETTLSIIELFEALKAALQKADAQDALTPAPTEENT